MSTTEITDEQRLTMLKHLASGKDLDTVATIVRHPRALVLDVVSKHGYPNSLQKGIDALTAKIDRDQSALPEGRDIQTAPRVPRPATTSPSSVTSPDARPVGRPDEIRVLINTAKAHPSKRIQQQANRVLDAIGRLRDLITEDEAKHAARRQEEAEKAAAKAEIARLEKQLAAAKAKLRGKPVAGGVTVTVPPGVPAAEVQRITAPKVESPCPDCGKVFDTVQGLGLHQRRHCPKRQQAAS